MKRFCTHKNMCTHITSFLHTYHKILQKHHIILHIHHKILHIHHEVLHTNPKILKNCNVPSRHSRQINDHSYITSNNSVATGKLIVLHSYGSPTDFRISAMLTTNVILINQVLFGTFGSSL